MTKVNEVFYRADENGNAVILFKEDGEAATRLDVENIYPVDSGLSAKYEHPEGIVLSMEDAKRLEIESE